MWWAFEGGTRRDEQRAPRRLPSTLGDGVVVWSKQRSLDPCVSGPEHPSSARVGDARRSRRQACRRAITSDVTVGIEHLSTDVLVADRGLAPLEKLRLVLEICTLRLMVARILRRQSDPRTAIQELRRRVSNSARIEPADPSGRVVARLAWSSRAVLERLPGDHRCLAQSLVLTALLSRRGVVSRVIIGVRRMSPAGPLTAHAWVTVDGHAVSPPGDHAQLVDL